MSSTTAVKFGAFLLLLLSLAGKASAQSETAAAPQVQAATPSSAAPDYALPENWVCRADKETACTEDLDTLVHLKDGTTRIDHFVPAAHPAVDCFYVYPTVSGEDTPYADMRETAQVRRVVHSQAGRFSSLCRVFAPIYRQGTMQRLRERMAGGKVALEDYPKKDINAAWDYYLAHYNQGRGVIFISHSQGTGIVQSLLASRIDGQPAQKLLIAAFLAGDPSLAVPPGKTAGGTFKQIPVCSSASQVGCVYAWGTYEDSDPTKSQNFGRPRADGLVSACANPAAPSGGSAPTIFIHVKAKDAPAADPPFVEYVDQVLGGCKQEPAGNGFRVSVPPGPNQQAIQALIQSVNHFPNWGIHGLDVFLVQGNMMAGMNAEIKTWTAKH